jgi:hypothetical protein
VWVKGVLSWWQDENWFDTYSADMFDISAGAHLCAMNVRLKAAHTITVSEKKHSDAWVST